MNVRASLVALCLAVPIATHAQATNWSARYSAIAKSTRISDSARLHRLFDLDWQYTHIEYPEAATLEGFPGQDSRWTDNSVAAIHRRQNELRMRLAALESVNRAKLNESDRLSYDIFRRGLEESIEGIRFPSDLLAITQMGGPQYLADLIAQMPATKASDYDAILTRLRTLPMVIDQTLVLLDSGLALGVTPPRITLRDVPAQVAALIPDSALASPLLSPFTHYPASVSDADRARLTTAAQQVYASEVKPAYAKLHDYLADKYVPHARESIALGALPDGDAWYAYNVRVETTTSRTPKEIHEIGLREVARIRAEMDSVIKSTGFTGDFAAFTNMLRTDPRFFIKDSASLVRAYRDIAKRIDPGLAQLFGRLPRLPYGVSTIPSYSAPSQTTAYYQPGSPDAHRAGEYMVNTYKLDTRPTWEMEALTSHESVPGHHLQIALAQELENLPQFRRYGGYTAFVEGWALYAESLGGSLGLYQDPYSKFGQLTYDMWRAVRLVVDTGIHQFGWTRQQAIDYFKSNSAKTENDITVEVDRYIVWPGQALAYKSGQLEILALRQYAQQQLGPRFDIRAFHDEVLGQGALPLDILDARVRAWVDATKKVASR